MARVRVPGTIGRQISTRRCRTGRDEDYVERARELLDVAVASATHDTPRVAIATSGGLDSSAIAATAARQGRAESITCFCMVPPPGTDVDVGPFRYLDERDKVEELARMYPSLNIRFIALIASIPRRTTIRCISCRRNCLRSRRRASECLIGLKRWPRPAIGRC